MTRGTRRCFVALPVGPGVGAQLVAVQDELERRLPSGTLRRTRPEGFHLTLLFLGDLAAPDVARARAGLERACRGHAPFELETAAPGCFPGPRRPRVLWLGVGGDTGALAALQRDVRRELGDLGDPGRAPEAGPFRAHLTLARVKARDTPARMRDRGRAGAVVEALRALPGLEPVRWPVERVALLESELRSAGAVYAPLAEAGLERG